MDSSKRDIERTLRAGLKIIVFSLEQKADQMTAFFKGNK